ncbi:MAG TPA: CGNR zinc finger domain-containing protein [Candidatus Sulfotelmatobacter sp.]|nr:CGNR zinc finger domain-containing protein [Candidatus Sulfotelmatobacter sp.]
MVETYLQSKDPRRRESSFDLVAGALCLDFINTLDDRFTKQPKELLKQYHDLVRFGEDTGTLDIRIVDALLLRRARQPEDAKQVLEIAITVREAMFAVFDAIVKKKPIPEGPMVRVNQFIQYAGRHARLVPGDGRFEWRFDVPPFDLETPLSPIALSVANLLSSDQLPLVRTCASETCQWFFLDTSKNHGRRWCDMTKCGNRAKFRRFYSRNKKSG